MTSTSPNLEIRNMSRWYELPNGTGALVPTSTNDESHVAFIKSYCCWKRIRLADKSRVNVAIDRDLCGEPGLGGFLEVQQLPELPKHVGSDRGQAALPSLSLRFPLSLAKDGICKDRDLPAFRAGLEREVKLFIFLNVVINDPEVSIVQHCIPINACVDGKPITRGQLAKHAATAMIELMDRCKANGFPLCYNNIEIDLDDLLLVDLQQVTEKHIRPTIAVWDF